MIVVPAEGKHVVELHNLSRGLSGSLLLIDEILETGERGNTRNGVNFDDRKVALQKGVLVN